MTLCLFCAGLTAVIPISMIVIGAIYKDECPTQPYIPLCLIVTGSFSFLTCFTCVFGCLSKRRKTSDRTHDVSCRHGISGLLFICLICSYIAGDVWIFKAYEPSYEDPSAPDYCDKTLYLFSCWMMNISFLLVGFGGCISALVGWWVG
ncbi:transmembrane protein 272-like [Saccoglossus kowalevskii]